MNTDDCFFIGRSHKIVEDYAISGMFGNLAYAIVSDGCSESSDVDIGARILVKSTQEILLRCAPEDRHDDVDIFGIACIHKANRVMDVMSTLSRKALDATLLAAWFYDKKATIVQHGDGVIIHKTKSELWVYHTNLVSGAPDYLSYHLDATRMAAYTQSYMTPKITTTYLNGELLDTVNRLPFEPVIIQKPVEEGDIIAVISDGIGTFTDQNGSSIKWQDIIGEFIGFKTTCGQFVQRRIGAYMRKCNKEFISHADDISMASIIV